VKAKLSKVEAVFMEEFRQRGPFICPLAFKKCNGFVQNVYENH
jgi:hypothetical protein